ncbi:MAG: PorP/SprF family type IX secretion system membrane protein [Bernardetiaceae bacterium]
MKRITLILASLLLCATAWGQDPHFSQNGFAVPTYLNPALAGNTVDWRVSATHRTQWTGLSNNFNTTFFSADKNIPEMNAGAGLMFYHDRAGEYITNTVSASLSYSGAKFKGKNMFILMGLNIGYTNRELDPNRFTFRDQLQLDSEELLATDERLPSQINYGTPIFGAGAVFKMRKMGGFWLGAAANNLGVAGSTKSTLDGETIANIPLRLTIHGGFDFNILSAYNPDNNWKARKLILTPGFIFSTQGGQTQLSAGTGFSYRPRESFFGRYEDQFDIVGGFWYKGLIGQEEFSDVTKQWQIREFSVSMGVDTRGLAIIYSYGLTSSNFAATGDTHEISLIFRTGLFSFIQNQQVGKRYQSGQHNSIISPVHTYNNELIGNK